MMRFICVAILLASLAGAAAGQTAYVTERRLQMLTEPERAGNPLALWPLEWGVEPGLPDASLADFSGLLRPPAGSDGATTVTAAGRFASARTGEQRRFWGVSLGLAQVDIPTWQIGAFAESLARNGVNLVRFTGLDDNSGPRSLAGRRLGGPGGDSQSPHPEVLDRFDYWVASCKEHGIYVAVRLLDGRQFGARDGVAAADALPPGGGPAALFDERLIELQALFARMLLRDHVNRYTGQPLGDDPALAWVELRAPLDMLAWDWSQLPEPYREPLHMKWNAWLRAKHGTTDRLFRAWTNDASESALLSGESLENNSVALPDQPLATIRRGLVPHPDGFMPALQARLLDAIGFAASVQNESAARLGRGLRQMGVAAPLVARGARFTELGHDGYVALNVLLDELAPDAELDSARDPGDVFFVDVLWRRREGCALIVHSGRGALSRAGGMMPVLSRLAEFQADGFLVDCTAWPVSPLERRAVLPPPSFWREMGMLGAMWRRDGNAMDATLRPGMTDYQGTSLALWTLASFGPGRPNSNDGNTTAALRWEGAAGLTYAAALALDARPLSYSQKILLRGRMTEPARPTTDDGVTTETLVDDSTSTETLLRDAPREPARLMRNDAPLLGVSVGAGEWEALIDRDGRRAWLWASEPGAAFDWGEPLRSAREMFLDVEPRNLKIEAERRVVWPGGGLYLEIRW